MNENKIKGLTTELQCQTYLTSLGYNVCIPLGEDCRYDMIADFNGYLARIQIKTCSLSETGITFSVRSIRMNHTEGNITHTYDKEQIDFFATFYGNKMYMIPVELCGTSTRTLAFNSSKFANNQLLLEDYLADKQIAKILNGTFLEDEMQKMSEKVAQYDLKNNFIKSYNNYTEAALSIGKDKHSATHIADVVKGKRKTAYGFVWKIIQEN